MPFATYISIVLGILGFYYFIVILFDLLKSGNKSVQVTTHTVQFPEYEKPVIISDKPEEIKPPATSGSDENLKKYLPPDDSDENKKIKRKAPIVDLGLETISGEAYTVNAENLSKFMIA
jgi:hypothetical protein